EIRPSEMFEIHCQEGHIVDDIAPPQAVVELEAVEDPRTLIEAKNVVCKEIAVAVDDASIRDPIAQERTAAVDVSMGEASNIADELTILSDEIKRLDLDKALLPQIVESGCSRHTRDLSVSRRMLVKHRNRPG